MSRKINTVVDDIDSVITTCPNMASAFNLAGRPLVRDRGPGFSALLRVIVDQQISVQAGAVIWHKFAGSIGKI